MCPESHTPAPGRWSAGVWKAAAPTLHPAPSHTPWKTLRVSHSPPATTASWREGGMHSSNCRRRTRIVDAGDGGVGQGQGVGRPTFPHPSIQVESGRSSSSHAATARELTSGGRRYILLSIYAMWFTEQSEPDEATAPRKGDTMRLKMLASLTFLLLILIGLEVPLSAEMAGVCTFTSEGSCTTCCCPTRTGEDCWTACPPWTQTCP